MAHAQVLLIIAHLGYQPIEYQIPKKTLTQAEFTVVTASSQPGTAFASDNSTTKVDITLDEANVVDYEAIIFVGGPGALDDLDNETSYQLIQDAVEAGILVCAICISPRILAHSGTLTGASATGWDDDNQLKGIFNEYQVKYVPSAVVHDQGFITATGPAAAQAFADEIVKELKK